MFNRNTPQAQPQGIIGRGAGEDWSAALSKLRSASQADQLRHMAMAPDGTVYDATTPQGKLFAERLKQERAFGTPTSLSAGLQWGGFEQYAGDRNRMLRSIGEREVDPYAQLVGPRDSSGVGQPGGMREVAGALSAADDPRDPGRMQGFLKGLRRAAGSAWGV